MPYSKQMEQIQRMLNLNFGQSVDEDGFIGPSTEGAILDVLMQNRPITKIGPPAEAVGPPDTDLSEDSPISLEWRSQFDDAYKADLLRPGGDTIQRSGCYATCMAMILDRSVPDIVSELNTRNAFYKETSLIDWTVLTEIGGRACLQNVGFDIGLEYLEKGTPIILHFPRGHFVVAIGLEDESHFRVLDPGSGMGNGNEMDNEKTIIPFDEVDRIDVLA